jgi:hypothetical protein
LRLLLILDGFPEGADVLGTYDVDREDVIGIHDAVKIDVMIKVA